MTLPSFILASASPARRKLLENAGIQPMVCPSDFDESQVQTDDPAMLVQALARGKAEVIASTTSNGLILGCDSVLAMHGAIHGKPGSMEEAIARWQTMRGQVGKLYTGHALIDQTQNQTIVRCQITEVHFAEVSDRQIETYVASGEPLHCAGCFALEGRGGFFVEKLVGCHSNVIGLSLPLLRQMMQDLGYDITECWQPLHPGLG